MPQANELPNLDIHLANLKFLKEDLAELYAANPSDDIRLGAANISLDLSPIENYLRSLNFLVSQVKANELQGATN
jgi:hypothetical protein